MYQNNLTIWKKKSKILKTNKGLTICNTMLSYCLKCRKNTESKNPNVSKTKNGRIMILSKCSACNNKKWNFLKNKKVQDY